MTDVCLGPLQQLMGWPPSFALERKGGHPISLEGPSTHISHVSVERRA